MQYKKIVGPPGTGKTHYLIETVESMYVEGAEPNQICYLAFTRKAANEARSRIHQKLGFSGDQIPWFKTVHALAFRQLALTKADVMAPSDYWNLGGIVGLHFTTTNSFSQFDELGLGMSHGDRVLFTANLMRITDSSVDAVIEKFDLDIDPMEVQYLYDTLAQYKNLNKKIDFTDMLNLFIEYKAKPLGLKHLIVDEAQDLSPIQWKVIDYIGDGCESIHIAGDDDQAIYKWAGADVDEFIDRPWETVVLPRSYRVPRTIQVLADGIASKISHRVPKVWESHTEEGSIQHIMSVDEVDMSTGTWLLLARNTYLLTIYQDHCLRMGYIFESVIESPIDDDAFRAICLWEKLRKGETVTVTDARLVYQYMSTRDRVKYGFKGALDKADETRHVNIKTLREDFGLLHEHIWHIALDKLSDEVREYFITALKNGEKVLKEPRIKINTIHGVKGGEADNVVLITDMAPRTFQEYLKNQDDEMRVWYVGITRARHNLYIVQPMTNRNFEYL